MVIISGVLIFRIFTVFVTKTFGGYAFLQETVVVEISEFILSASPFAS